MWKEWELNLNFKQNKKFGWKGDKKNSKTESACNV